MMRLPLSLQLTAAAAALVIATACSDATAPSTVGTYTLARVNSLVLPAQFLDAASGQTVTVTGGTLSMSDDRRWTAEITVQVALDGVLIPSNKYNVRGYQTALRFRNRDLIVQREPRRSFGRLPAVGVTWQF